MILINLFLRVYLVLYLKKIKEIYSIGDSQKDKVFIENNMK